MEPTVELLILENGSRIKVVEEAMVEREGDVVQREVNIERLEERSESFQILNNPPEVDAPLKKDAPSRNEMLKSFVENPCRGNSLLLERTRPARMKILVEIEAPLREGVPCKDEDHCRERTHPARMKILVEVEAPLREDAPSKNKNLGQGNLLLIRRMYPPRIISLVEENDQTRGYNRLQENSFEKIPPYKIKETSPRSGQGNERVPVQGLSSSGQRHMFVLALDKAKGLSSLRMTQQACPCSGQVLVEKILRTMPEVDKIYLLIKAKNEEAAAERLMNECLSTELFQCLREKYGTLFENFILNKLVPVVGNMCETDIGMEENVANRIAREADVIINSAAATAFDERYDISLDINTGGAARIVSFAKKCENLKLYVHISTVSTLKSSWREKEGYEVDNIAIENSWSNPNFELSIPSNKVIEEVNTLHKNPSILFEYSVEDTEASKPFDLEFRWINHVVWSSPKAPFSTSRFLTGSGNERGAIAISLESSRRKAYVSRQHEGKIIEESLGKGHYVASKADISEAPHKHVPGLNIEAEMKFALEMKESFRDNEKEEKLKELGMTRAQKYGWPNTYAFTKAMGEMAVEDTKGHLPVIIIRPTVVESTYKQPFPGWIEGNRMMDPIIIWYGKGKVPGFLSSSDVTLDVVPADIVVSSTLAAIAKHGREESKLKHASSGDNHVYHIASSIANPLFNRDLLNMAYQHFSVNPCFDRKGNPIRISPYKFFTSAEDMLLDMKNSAGNEKKSPIQELVRRKSMELVKYLANLYQPYTFFNGRFDNSKAEELMKCLSEEERKEFGFDASSIDWNDYIKNVHFPGIRKHVMKERSYK
ncbi:hypothetical protein AgCh_005835 [Apium graveolens]